MRPVAPLFLAICGLVTLATTVLSAPLKVASLSTITTDIAKNVGGNLVEISGIVKPGVDPHEFQPSPEDAKKITQADIVLLTGKGIEGYLTKLESSAPHARFIDTGKVIPSLQLMEDGKQVEDPHWWHSIENVRKVVSVVREAFIQADPAHEADFEKNTVAYQAQLDELEKWAKTKIASLPREKRKLVTTHDAFQYFARDFGFQIHAIEGVSSTDEPSSKKVADLIKTIRSEGVKAVFFENIENPKVIQEITKETGAKVGGQLYADGLGDKEATTYIEMVKYNITTIVDNLK